MFWQFIFCERAPGRSMNELKAGLDAVVNIKIEEPVAIYVKERAVPDHQNLAIVDKEKE